MAVELPVKVKVVGVAEAKQALTGLAKTAAGIFAVDKLVKFAETGLVEWSKLQTASNELSAAIGHQSIALEKLATTSMRQSTFRTAEIEQGYKRLALYGLTEAQIIKLSPVMLNLATITGSTESAARLLGQAIETGSGRLSMYGIKVDKTMTVNERFNSILKQSENAFGGQSKAAFDAMNPLEKMSRVIDEASAGIGDALVPDLNILANNLPDFRDAIENIARVGLTIFKTAVFAVDVAVAGLIDSVAIMANAILALPRLIPGVKHFTDPAIEFFNRLAKVANKNIKDTIDNTARMWDKSAEEQDKAAQKIARNKTIRDRDEEKENERRRKEALAKEKKFLEEKRSLTEKLEHDAAQIGMTEYQKKLNDLGIQYEKDQKMLSGDKEALLNLEKVYAANVKDVMDDEAKDLEEKNKKEKQLDDKAEKEKQKALDKFNSVAESKQEKTYKNEMEKLEKHYRDDKALLEKYGYDTTALTEQFEREKNELKENSYRKGLSEITSNLESIASKHKEWTGAYKTMAVAQATIDTYKAAQSIFAGWSTMPFIGKAIGLVEAAAAIGFGLSNVQQIASAKMAYGGVVTGGIEGRDSVPAMLTPGEIVYNPEHPNPVLASMITNTNNNNDVSHYHLSMPITIHGNPSDTSVARAGEIFQKHLFAALRKAQQMGKVTANGLKIGR